MKQDPTLAGVLEPGQLAVMTARKLSRRVLGRGTLTLLVLLRIYVVLAIPIVLYAFIHALATPPA